jgi:hypothetical protein
LLDTLSFLEADIGSPLYGKMILSGSCHDSDDWNLMKESEKISG